MRYTTILLVVLLGLASCTEDEVREPDAGDTTAASDSFGALPNAVRIPDSGVSELDTPDVLDNREGAPRETAERPGRIRFAPGATAATVLGSLGPESDTTFYLDARKGQTMHVSVEGSTEFHDVVLSIEGPNGISVMGEGDVDNQWSGVLPATGEYRIRVDMIESEYSEFELEVAIE